VIGSILFYVAAWGLLTFGIVLSFDNFLNAIRQIRAIKTGSTVPILGGASLALGLSMLPNLSPKWIWCIGFFIDYGCLPLLGSVLLFKFKKRQQ
jgi:hypothetical protein